MSTFQDWSTHEEEVWDRTQRFLDRLGRAQTMVDADGYESSVAAAADDDRNVRLAWIETREKETRRGYWDVTHTLWATQDGDILAKWELPTYNPFFGCKIGYIKWFGDSVAVIYREKHESIVAVFDTRSQSSLRLLPIQDDWTAVATTIFFRSEERGLIESCSLPSLTLGVPIPSEHSEPALRYIPKTDVPADDFAGQVTSILYGQAPPPPLVDLLVGTAAYRFWDTWPNPVSQYGFVKRWNSPYWLPFYWYQCVGDSDRSMMLSILDDLATREIRDESETADSATNIAARHVCNCAASWATACRSDAIPEDTWCHFWIEWSQKAFRESLELFPAGFRDAYEQTADARSAKNERTKRGFFSRLFGR